MDPIKQADDAVQAEVKQLESNADVVWIKSHWVWMVGFGCLLLGVLIGAVLARHP